MICTHVCLYVIQMQLLIILNVHQSLEVMFLFLHFKDVKIAALLDSGSTTNLKVLVMLIKRGLIHF